MEVPAGAHTLQLVYRFGLSSTVETFSVRAGETAGFVCCSRLLRRGSRISLARTGHGRGGSPAEPDQGLIMEISAAQANQPGIRR